ncbi:MAG: S-layer homology domain-containing protein [Oscillospiraceae bacterium]|nr:S-layer homology domain-containing protein [Oscillospiraceae bacterium]
MKKWIMCLLAMSLLLSTALPVRANAVVRAAGSPPRFSDVDAESWYAPYVLALSRRGVIRGYDDGSFRPRGTVSWGEALKLVLLTAGFPEQRAGAGAHWAAGYLDFARAKEYLPKDAAPDLAEPITRIALAEVCASALEMDGKASEAEEAEVESPFADTSERSVLALWEAGIVEGSTAADGRQVFDGSDFLTRAEISAILVRMQDYVDTHFVFVSGSRAAIDFSLRFREYDPESFRAESGRIVCDDETLSRRLGVDVSYYQGEIDWEAVAADGVDFAIIRCGYRGYGSAGTLNEDSRFRENIEGALRAGLDVGVYFFSQAVTVEEAVEEAEYTLELIRDYDVRFPVVFDWEKLSSAGSRSRSPDWETVSDCAVAFCEAVAAAGYTPMAYYNKYMSYIELNMRKIQQYDGWLAMYQNAMDYIYDFQMWQFTSDGAVDGIDGRVDLNLCLADYAAE